MPSEVDRLDVHREIPATSQSKPRSLQLKLPFVPRYATALDIDCIDADIDYTNADADCTVAVSG